MLTEREEWRALENYAQVDLAAITHNYRSLQEKCAVPVIAVLKANAYGHGLLPVFQALRRAGAERFAVANLTEALALQEADGGGSVLILGNTTPEHMAVARERGIACTLFCREQWEELRALLTGQSAGKPLGVHVKIDTGFHRLGFAPAGESIPLLREILACPQVKVEGIYSHLALLDEESDREQMGRFAGFLAALEAAGAPLAALGTRHIADSISAVTYPWARLDAVRVGAALYGLRDDRPAYQPFDLRPALRLWGRVAQLRRISPGEGVGYDYSFVADRPMVIATIALGYADGYPRALSGGKGAFLLHGRLAPVLGLICMDQLVVDVTDIPQTRRGDRALAYESAWSSPVGVGRVALQAGGNKNALVAALAHRVTRIYE